MSKYIIDSATLTGIADAIRSKRAESGVIPVTDMAYKIASLPDIAMGLRRTVVATLAHCEMDNERPYAISGHSYVSNIAAEDGYALDEITVIMGNTDVTQDCLIKNQTMPNVTEKVVIPNVTGNIEIVATTVPLIQVVNLMYGKSMYVGQRRRSSSYGLLAANDQVTTPWLDITDHVMPERTNILRCNKDLFTYGSSNLDFIFLSRSGDEVSAQTEENKVSCQYIKNTTFTSSYDSTTGIYSMQCDWGWAIPTDTRIWVSITSTPANTPITTAAWQNVVLTLNQPIVQEVHDNG